MPCTAAPTASTCGRGVDAVTADLADTVARDCEFVSRRISADSLTSAGGQHQTQVEPSVAGAGTTAVATFQVGRFGDGGAAGIGWSTSTDSGRTWRTGILPSLTVASRPAGDAPRASDPAVAYDAAHATWLIATLVLGCDLHRPRHQPLGGRSKLERADVRRPLRLELARLRQGMGRLRQHDDEPVLRKLLPRLHGHRDAARGGAGVAGRRRDLGRAGHGHERVRDRGRKAPCR